MQLVSRMVRSFGASLYIIILTFSPTTNFGAAALVGVGITIGTSQPAEAGGKCRKFGLRKFLRKTGNKVGVAYQNTAGNGRGCGFGVHPISEKAAAGYARASCIKYASEKHKNTSINCQQVFVIKR